MTLPDGFRIERVEPRHGPVEFQVYEEGGPTWKDGSPRDVVTVEVWPGWDGVRPKTVSWPSTSDKRPVLAMALACALAMAAEEAMQPQPTKGSP